MGGWLWAIKTVCTGVIVPENNQLPVKKLESKAAIAYNYA